MVAQFLPVLVAFSLATPIAKQWLHPVKTTSNEKTPTSSTDEQQKSKPRSLTESTPFFDSHAGQSDYNSRNGDCTNFAVALKVKYGCPIDAGYSQKHPIVPAPTPFGDQSRQISLEV